MPLISNFCILIFPACSSVAQIYWNCCQQQLLWPAMVLRVALEIGRYTVEGDKWSFVSFISGARVRPTFQEVIMEVNNFYSGSKIIFLSTSGLICLFSLCWADLISSVFELVKFPLQWLRNLSKQIFLLSTRMHNISIGIQSCNVLGCELSFWNFFSICHCCWQVWQIAQDSGKSLGAGSAPGCLLLLSSEIQIKVRGFKLYLPHST